MKINLHCHSDYSDGYESVSVMAEEHKKLGYSAFVVTDHCYPTFVKKDLESGRMMTSFKKFCKQTEELASVSKDLDYPCLQGIELALVGEEVLVFGKETVEEIFDYVETINLKEQEKYGHLKNYHQKLSKNLIEILKTNKDKSAVILCHPHLFSTPEWLEDSLFKIIDGYEFQNNGHYFFSDDTNADEKHKWDREIPEGLKNKKKFYNSDAHSLSQVPRTNGNFHDKEIKTLEDLINFIKSPPDLGRAVQIKMCQDLKQNS